MSFFIEPIERNGEEMRLGDVMAKLGRGNALTPLEVAFIQEQFNLSQSTVATTSGWIDGNGNIRVGNLYADNAFYGTFPFMGARVMRDAAQTDIANATYTDVVFDTLDYQDYQKGSTRKFFDPAVSTIKLYIPTNGIYAFTGEVRFEQDGAGTREVWIYSNRTDDAATGHIAMAHAPAYALAGTAVTVAGTFEFASGDWISLRVWQNSGDVLFIDNARVSIWRIR
jgi:hypothetical protein